MNIIIYLVNIFYGQISLGLFLSWTCDLAKIGYIFEHESPSLILRGIMLQADLFLSKKQFEIKEKEDWETQNSIKRFLEPMIEFLSSTMALNFQQTS